MTLSEIRNLTLENFQFISKIWILCFVYKWLQLEETHGHHQVQPHCSYRITIYRLPREVVELLSVEIVSWIQSWYSQLDTVLCQDSVKPSKIIIWQLDRITCFIFSPLALVLSLHTTEKSLTPSPLPPSHQVCIYSSQILWDFQFSRRNSLRSLSFSW